MYFWITKELDLMEKLDVDSLILKDFLRTESVETLALCVRGRGVMP